MKKAWREFKSFALGGNVIDLAVGVIIGAAFATVVQSMANNIVGDLLGALFGKTSFDALVAHVGRGDVHYGKFLTSIISFLITVSALYVIVKGFRRAKIGTAQARGLRECPECLELIAIAAKRCKFCTMPLAPIPGAPMPAAPMPAAPAPTPAA